MISLSLQQLFGARAYQDSASVVIDKRDLINLSASPINTAESLLVAILLNAQEQFVGLITDQNNQPITDELNSAIAFDHTDAYLLLRLFFWKKQFIISNKQGFIQSTFVVESFNAI